MPYILRGQTEDVAMHFAAFPSDPVATVNGGLTSAYETGDMKSGIQAGYMLFFPTESPVSYISLKGSYKLNDSICLSLNGTYGICEEYEMFNGSGLSDGFYRPGQMMLAAGAEYRFIDFMKAGIRLKYLTEGLAPESRHNAFASDIYLAGKVALSSLSSIDFGLGINNLGTKVTSSSGSKFTLPTALNIHCGYGLNSDRNMIEASVGADYFLHGRLAAAAGLSYTYNDFISARFGYRYGGESVLPSYCSAGLGFKFFGAELDLAYLFGSDVLSNSMCISLGYTF